MLMFAGISTEEDTVYVPPFSAIAQAPGQEDDAEDSAFASVRKGLSSVPVPLSLPEVEA